MKGYEQYFAGIERIFAEIREKEGASIEKAAGYVAEAVIADGLVHIFGTGHSNIIAEEVFARANTLAPVSQVADLSMAGSVNTRAQLLPGKAGRRRADDLRARARPSAGRLHRDFEFGPERRAHRRRPLRHRRPGTR